MTKHTRLGKDGAPLTWSGEKPAFATRIRRGKVVEIPPEWINKVPTPATIRQRPSKLTGKLRRRLKATSAKIAARNTPLLDD
jgi:hypothetical protein